MKKQVKKKTESGRSMVEMLGVLAIIGVLSVAGVSGYGRAINAHRANTAIETAQREAAIVAGDVVTGQKVEPGNTTVLKSPSGYEVAVRDAVGGTTEIKSTSPFFGVEIGGGNGQAVQRNVAKSVVERAVDDWTNVHGIGVISGEGESRTIKWLKSAGAETSGFETEVPESDQTVTLIVVYATDLSQRSGDLRTDIALPPDPNACNPACNSCSLCEEGRCTINYDMDGEECRTTDDKEGVCSAGECESTSADNCPGGTTVEEGYTGTDALADGKCICTSYTDNQCGSGWYCAMENTYSCDITPTSGRCTRINAASVGSEYYTNVGEEMDWWSAYSFCRGLGKSLIDLSAECTAEEYAAVEAVGEKIRNSDYSWSSPTCARFVSNGDYRGYWTVNAVDADCNRFTVTMPEGTVSYYFHSGTSDRPLCK